MKKSSLAAVLIIFSSTAAILFLTLGTLAGSAAARPQSPAITPTPSVTPSVTPFIDPFSATLTITADQPVVAFGEELLVTIDLDVVEGCQYPVFEISLYQDGDDAPLFTYIDPPATVVGPPVSFPFTYRLLAVNSGQITLRAQTYGERNCNDFWAWTYLGSSMPITVSGSTSRTYLPLLTAE